MTSRFASVSLRITSIARGPCIASCVYASLKSSTTQSKPFVFSRTQLMSFSRVPALMTSRIVVLAQAMNDHVVHKRPLRIKQRRIVRLTDRQLRRIVHAEVLHRSERAARRTPRANPNVAHVANVENCHTEPRTALCSATKPAARRILDGHIPAAKIDHFRAQPPVHGVERRLSKFGDCRRVVLIPFRMLKQKSILARARNTRQRRRVQTQLMAHRSKAGQTH